MNAREISEEVVSWYYTHADPYKPHLVNVRRHLQGPVFTLTHDILTGKDEGVPSRSSSEGDIKEDEKKCCIGDGNSANSKSEGGLLDKSLWNNSKATDDIYNSLSRRHRARLDAFLTNVEIAMASENERSASPTLSMESLPEEKDESAKQSNTEEAPPTKQGKKAPKIPPRKSITRKHIGSSPVLSSLNNHGKALLRSVSIESNIGVKQPQIRQRELRVRLELYLRSLYRVRSLERDCVIAMEPDRAIKARTEMIVSAFISTVGCVRSVGPVLTKLLVTLTKELFAVEYVGEELLRVVRRIVNEYEHGTSFASLAFISSPDESAEKRLTPLLLKYIKYLQSDWKSHERACELERLLSCCLDGDMRRYLKTVEFQSIGHLLEVCQGFRTELNTIELLPSNASDGKQMDLCNNPDAVRQAIRDLQREVITINGHVLPPVTSRKDLIHLLSQSLNSKSLTADPLQKNNDDDGLPISQSCPSFISTEVSTEGSMDNDVDSSLDNSPDHVQIKRKNSSGNMNVRANFHLSTVDLLTRRLLIAASRTGTGGDAYFIVRDLFGDEDVEVVPAKVLPHHVRASRVGSIEIQVRLASVTIKCHGSFDIYPKSLVGCCEPLIQLHTTSSETIYLQELRPCDSASDDGRQCFEDDGSRSSDGMEALVLQEKKTNKTGRRFLSIRPALYEKVQVWNTPS